MPSRNEIKELLPRATYHVYNRGVERRQIFLDSRDYHRFLRQISQALDREPGITLHAYSLMPNHFHLLVSQAEPRLLSRFLQRLTISYVMYFNRKHNRVGPLFQGKYKAVRIIGSEQLMEVSRYIHLNPERAGFNWRQHDYSSMRLYLDGWPSSSSGPDSALPNIDPRPVLDLFDVPGDYRHYLSLGKSRSKLRS